MRYRANGRSTAVLAIKLFTFSIVGTASLAANLSPESLVNPQLRVRVYSFAGLSPGLLASAEIEADRFLGDVRVNFGWVDCTSSKASAVCTVDLTPRDLVVRVVTKALPQATTDALGIAGSSNGEASAFLFYDRMLVLRTHARPLQFIVGRVLAHEIVHMLLPAQRHSELGLMRALWSADDLRPQSFACVGLPITSALLIEREALRRVASADNLGSK